MQDRTTKNEWKLQPPPVKDARIVVLRPTDTPDDREYAVNFALLPHGTVAQFDRRDKGTKHLLSRKRPLPEEIINLCDDLWSIEGLESVFIEPYKIIVTKGAAFRWAKIEASVIDCINFQFFMGNFPGRKIEHRKNSPVHA